MRISGALVGVGLWACGCGGSSFEAVAGTDGGSAAHDQVAAEASAGDESAQGDGAGDPPDVGEDGPVLSLGEDSPSSGSSSGGAVPCSAATCPNGCCSYGACQESNIVTCGLGGAACTNCTTTGWTCVDGACTGGMTGSSSSGGVSSSSSSSSSGAGSSGGGSDASATFECANTGILCPTQVSEGVACCAVGVGQNPTRCGHMAEGGTVCITL